MTTIVVGIDGSEESREALRLALEEARLRGAKVHAVHAWRLVSRGLGAPLLWPPTIETEGKIEEEYERWLDGIVREAAGDAPDVEITTSVVEQEPATALIEAAQDAELLIVGSRGHGGFTGLLLGSVSQQCAHHAPCPVVIVRGGRRRGAISS